MEEGYRQVHEQINFLRKYAPGFEQVKICDISSTLGIRETRHFHGIRRLTKEEMFAYRQDGETIALCGYNVDIHAGKGDHIDLSPLERAFGLPYGCFVARDVDNLYLAGRTLSVDSTVFAAARVMGPLMQASEGIGIAAAMCVNNGKNAQRMSTSRYCGKSCSKRARSWNCTDDSCPVVLTYWIS